MVKYRYLAFTMIRRFLIPFFLLILAFSAGAQERNDRFTVKLLVLGPGAPIYTWWGHTGIIIEDAMTQRSTFYDFGNFSFEEDNFYKNFLMGRLIYMSVGVPTELYLNHVLLENRELDIYTLDISQQNAAELNRLLREKIRPENRHYLYDHFEDNCSTRIRDYIDMALDGKLRDFTETEPAGTFRQQFKRFSYFNFPIDFMLSYLQGSYIDRDISQWDALYLPLELGLSLEELNQQENVISNHEKLSTAQEKFQRIAPLDQKTWPKPLYWGFGSALIYAMMFYVFHWRNTAWTIILLETGLLGTMLFLMTSFTDHHVTYHNMNLLYTSPVSLILLFLYKSRKIQIRKIFLSVWALLCLLALFTLLRDWFSTTGHHNRDTVLYFLPQYLLFAWMEWKVLKKLAAPSQKRSNFLSLYRRYGKQGSFSRSIRKYPGKYRQQIRRKSR